MAGKKGTLTTSLHPDLRTGKTGYRINANEEALKRLGVTPDFKARSELMYRLPKDPNKWKYHHYALAEKNQATLKYASNKPGSSGWSKTGQEALKKHPELAYWNDKAKLSQKAKTVLKEAGVGALKSFKDAVDVRGIANSGLLKGTGKALGPIGAGLSYYNNLQDANNDGLTGADAATRATVDTAIDLAVGGAVQAGSVALFTVIIPAPGVGTAIGVGVGILANIALNTKWGNSKKTPMDHIKSWFR
ncbi:hypothetical protein [Pueribacillus sp. YX66]|uniref:hypothetical protein n=1 Tax=Pueribacillus sp. YX66 TaxID=3229242 RepID=UPI00358D70C4